MKKPTSDFTDWQKEQENLSRPFPYVFPQMPPRFRLCRIAASAVFVLEWASRFFMIASSMVLCVFLLLHGGDFALIQETALLSGLTAAFLAALPFSALCRLVRHTPKLFWHCPCCGLPFPYYAPAHYLDALKGDGCLQAMDHLGLACFKPKGCPLIFPSVCPSCRCKFFEKL